MLAIADHSVTSVNVIHATDARQFLAAAPAEWVDCIVTSPPYYGLRDYQAAGQIGLEESLDDYIAALVDVFRLARRVLRPDGTLWVNLGDSYGRGARVKYHRDHLRGTNAHSRVANSEAYGRAGAILPNKQLLAIPWRVAQALQADGWILRSAAPWIKRQAMPESVNDRPANALEYVFLFSRSESYYYDAEAVRIGGPRRVRRAGGRYHEDRRPGRRDYRNRGGLADRDTVSQGRNRRNTDWFFEALDHDLAELAALRDQGGVHLDDRGLPIAFDVTPAPNVLPHYAIMPRALVRPMILAGSRPGGIVCDPFMGAGTSAIEAVILDRRFVGAELNSDTARLARQRVIYRGDDRRLMDERRAGVLQRSLFDVFAS